MSSELIIIENVFRLDSIVTNQDLRNKSEILAKGTCPMSIRTAFEANRNHTMQNGQPGRIRFCVGIGCGIPNLLEKIARACCFTGCLPCASVVSCGEENVYLVKGEIKRTWKRALEEWFDLCNSSSALTANVLGTINPSWTDNYLENIVDYYLTRIAERERHDKNFKLHVRAYGHFKVLQKEAWKNGTEPPNKEETIKKFVSEHESE